jgi:hypothetical protein
VCIPSPVRCMMEWNSEVLTGHDDGSIRFWTVAGDAVLQQKDGKPSQKFTKMHNTAVTCLSAMPNGQGVWSCSSAGSVRQMCAACLRTSTECRVPGKRSAHSTEVRTIGLRFFSKTSYNPHCFSGQCCCTCRFVARTVVDWYVHPDLYYQCTFGLKYIDRGQNNQIVVRLIRRMEADLGNSRRQSYVYGFSREHSLGRPFFGKNSRFRCRNCRMPGNLHLLIFFGLADKSPLWRRNVLTLRLGCKTSRVIRASHPCQLRKMQCGQVAENCRVVTLSGRDDAWARIKDSSLSLALRLLTLTV